MCTYVPKASTTREASSLPIYASKFIGTLSTRRDAKEREKELQIRSVPSVSDSMDEDPQFISVYCSYPVVVTHLLEYSKHYTNEIDSKVKLHPCALLSENNFDDCTKSHKFALVATYKKNCGHCMSLRPIFDKAAHALRIPLFGIDMRSQNVLMDKLGIDKVPTLLIYRNGKAPVVYGGVQNAKAIVDYVKILAKGAAVKLPSES